MKVICVMVTSVDGKSTRNSETDIYHWSSKEDQDHFFSLINNNHLLIMGKNTYEHAKHLMKHEKGRLRVVLTKTPNKFSNQSLPGMLEFTDQHPSNLLKALEKRGYKKALLLGGASTNAAFFKEQCVDELWLTVEPYLFGKGKPLVGENLLDISLQLISTKKLNRQGTLLLTYKVVH